MRKTRQAIARRHGSGGIVRIAPAMPGFVTAACLAPNGAWAAASTPFSPSDAGHAVLYQHAALLVGEIAGPDIYYAALMAGSDFFDDPRTVQVSAGGVAGQVPWMQAVSNDIDLPLAVARARGTSATAIKLYADLSGETAVRITDEAHRQHLLVWAHAALFPAKPSEVVKAGADVISDACLLAQEMDAAVPRWKQPRKPVNFEPFKSSPSPAMA
jgi:hypothetical protein